MTPEEFLFECMVAQQIRLLGMEFKTLVAIVGEISEKRRMGILKAIRKRPHLSVGEAYMDWTHE